MASSECKRQQLSTSLSRHRENLGFRPSEELHHQQVCYNIYLLKYNIKLEMKIDILIKFKYYNI